VSGGQHRPLILLALAACAPQPADRWPAVRDACALESAPSPWAVDAPSPLEPACAEALSAAVDVDGSLDEAAHEAVLRALWVVAATDLPPLSALEPDGFTSARLADRLRSDASALSLSDPPLQQLFFAELTAQCPLMRADPRSPEPGRLASHRSDACLLAPALFEQPVESVATVLVHEAWHGVGPGHVTCPDDPSLQCDRHLDGSYGTQAAWLALAADEATSPWAASRLESKAWEARARVVRP